MGIGLCLCGLLTANVGAETFTFQLNDGQTLTGDYVSCDENGLQLRLVSGSYKRTAWMQFSQADLKMLAQKRNIPKIAEFVEPFIEIPPEKRLEKTKVTIKPVERLDRPAKSSLLGALFGSSVGLVTLLLIYAANIYAGYEISVVRAYHPALVCGVSAVVPFIGPIVFICLPTRIISAEEYKPGESRAAAHAAAEAAQAAAVPEGDYAYPPPEAVEAKPALPKTQVFQRGKFTFNRRFFETKFAGFFGLVRRDPEKDMVLLFKTARGEYVASRVTRIAANDLHVEVRKGAASQEVTINFTEIQEVQLKHKDA